MLVLLNTYPLLQSQTMVFQSKETSMKSSVKLIEASLSGLKQLDEENVSKALTSMRETGVSRILVTDTAGRILYDTREENGAVGLYAFYTEIVQALEGYDAFYCNYDSTAFLSRMASPVVYHNQIVGAVYTYEYDTKQADILKSFQSNLMKISILIALAVLGLSVLLSRILTAQITDLLSAIRKVREGAYSHRAAVKGSDEIGQIAAEFNSLTRLDSGAVPPVTPVPVAPVLERVARMLAVLAREKNVTLSYEAEPQAVALATEDDVHQILYNLMDNGIKYSGTDGFVHAAAATDGDWVVLTVEDNGIGIPEDDLPHIFERFYRVDKMRSRAIGGTGLGLSIVKDTVENRGGSITAAARQGGGTVFTVRLPRAAKEGGDGQ